MEESTSSSSPPPQSPPPKLSFAAIVVIAANTMNGPGLTTLPSIASDSGQVTFSMLVMLAALVTSFVVHRLVHVMWASIQHKTTRPSPNAMQVDNVELDGLVETAEEGTGVNIIIPRMGTIRPTLEETDIVALSTKLFDHKKLASCAMVGCALALALAQMMLCAAIADSMLVASVGKSCGLGPFDLYCTSNFSMKPFQATTVDVNDQGMEKIMPISLISAGLVLASSITISLSLVDLNSLLLVQYVLFGCLLVACGRFWSTLREMGDDLPELTVDTSTFGNTYGDDEIPLLPVGAPYWIGPRPFDAVGPTLFNFAFVVTAPPLVCGTQSRAEGSRALIVACLLMGVLYMLIGCAGVDAATNTPFGWDDNLLSLILRGKDPEWMNNLDIGAVILFGLSQLAAIPVYCELARETLTVHLQVSNKYVAFLASHVCPWIVVALAYNSALFETFVEWSGLLLLGFANFSLPLLLDHVYTERLGHEESEKLNTFHIDHSPCCVAWGLALTTAAIAAVIIERITGSVLISAVVFLGTKVAIIRLQYKVVGG